MARGGARAAPRGVAAASCPHVADAEGDGGGGGGAVAEGGGDGGAAPAAVAGLVALGAAAVKLRYIGKLSLGLQRWLDDVRLRRANAARRRASVAAAQVNPEAVTAIQAAMRGKADRKRTAKKKAKRAAPPPPEGPGGSSSHAAPPMARPGGGLRRQNSIIDAELRTDSAYEGSSTAMDEMREEIVAKPKVHSKVVQHLVDALARAARA